MKEIKVLENSLINKIAAGEVIERPASVVKELIENSIDAGADSITIEIKEGGINLIKVTDNGVGIKKEEIKTAFLRHATSKIEKFDDLESILTLGFRGEALSSIASVSQVEVISKTKDEQLGNKVEIYGGKIINEQNIAANEGTTFIMRNLFFNTPARRKFLKKPSTESGYISDIINKTALGHPEISFKYINNNNVIIHTTGKNDLKETVLCIYGKSVCKKMIEINYKKDNYIINGLIAKPEMNRANRSYENFYINGRYVKSYTVNSAAEEAYKGKLLTGKFPIFVINMSIPANTVDVNVHPSKLEVRFENENLIYKMIYDTLNNALKNENLIPNVELDNKEIRELNNKKSFVNEIFNDNIYNKSDIKGQYNFENERKNNIVLGEPCKNDINFNENNVLLDSPEIKIFKKSSYLNENIPNIKKHNDVSFPKEVIVHQSSSLKENFFNNYKIIGQLFNTYWIVEQNNSMYLIDQHAAHERVLYEDIVNKVKNEEIVSQRLLQPAVVNISEKEMQVIENNKNLLESFGFEIEILNFNACAIKSVPFIFKGPFDSGLFLDIIDMLQDKNIESIYDIKLDSLASISCKAAVKGNNKLSYIEAKALIERILKIENPFTCPHGRPTIIEINKYEIEKKFKRIQN